MVATKWAWLAGSKLVSSDCLDFKTMVYLGPGKSPNEGYATYKAVSKKAKTYGNIQKTSLGGRLL